MSYRSGKENVIFRTKSESDCEVLISGILSDNEWKTDESLNRIYEQSWDSRYQYEAEMLSDIIKSNNINKVLEMGCGPGILCNKILQINPELEYHLIDIEAARVANENNNIGGIFHVQDLNNDFNIEGFDNDFDIFIANDFLEHIQSPANIIQKVKSILKKDGLAFISVPNWRMGHAWIYRGLFDWDNFIHFMWQHGFKFEGYNISPLKTNMNPKLDSEQSMPDEAINSWNFYLLFKRNDYEENNICITE